MTNAKIRVGQRNQAIDDRIKRMKEIEATGIMVRKMFGENPAIWRYLEDARVTQVQMTPKAEDHFLRLKAAADQTFDLIGMLDAIYEKVCDGDSSDGSFGERIYSRATGLAPLMVDLTAAAMLGPKVAAWLRWPEREDR